jgi:hypothetical protein
MDDLLTDRPAPAGGVAMDNDTIDDWSDLDEIADLVAMILGMGVE